MRELIKDIKKTIVFIGKLTPNGPIITATGFLISNKGYFYLVTAKHTIVQKVESKFTGELEDKDLCVFYNTKDGKIKARPINEIKKKFGVEWIFHKDNEVDLTVIPFGFDPTNDDVKTIQNELFLESDHLFEIYDVFFMSYQPGISYKHVLPIVRTGTISLIQDDKTFYIDASAFPGNSGSPVFLTPSPIRFGEKGVSIGGDKLGGMFIGIIGEYLPYQDVAISTQTGRPRVVFEENTGLSRVWSVSYIQEILKSDLAKEQLKKLLERKE